MPPHWLLRLLPLLLLAGCSAPYEPPLRLGTNTRIGYEPLFLARHLGRFGDDVKLVELTSATDVMHAFRNRLIEAAALTLDEVLTLRSDGLDVRVVLALSRSKAADALLAGPTLHAVAELRGRRVGVENSAVGALVLNGALEAGGLTAADVVPVPLAPNDHVEAYRTGSVDAIVTFEPMTGSLKALGARPLFTSGDLPEPVVDVLVVHPEVLLTRPRALRRLLQGWFDALAFLAREPLEALSVIGQRSRLERGDTADRMAGLQLLDRHENERLLGGTAPVIAAGAERLSAGMVRQGLLAPDVDTALLVDTRPLENTR